MVKTGIISVAVALVVGVALTWGTGDTAPSTTTSNKITNSTVMITNMKGNSGGTGVVVYNTPTLSKVLTNAHVCGLLKNGGKVVDSTGKANLPTKYIMSDEHDLCLITVLSGMPDSVTISNKGPERFEEALISGHPSLLPITVTKGHFSDKLVIQVMTGMRPCTEEDFADGLGMLCIFFGGVPVIKNYDSQFVTATIMPGSSGSGVYNSTGELVGVAFAGSGDLGYAHTVPYTYMRAFVNNNLQSKEGLTPNFTINIGRAIRERNGLKQNDLRSKCREKSHPSEKVTEICEIIVDVVP